MAQTAGRLCYTSPNVGPYIESLKHSNTPTHPHAWASGDERNITACQHTSRRTCTSLRVLHEAESSFIWTRFDKRLVKVPAVYTSASARCMRDHDQLNHRWRACVYNSPAQRSLSFIVLKFRPTENLQSLCLLLGVLCTTL
jgi:hypothetical protein